MATTTHESLSEPQMASVIETFDTMFYRLWEVLIDGITWQSATEQYDFEFTDPPESYQRLIEALSKHQ